MGYPPNAVWYPHPPPRKPKTPHQLARVQKRTLKFKTGEVRNKSFRNNNNSVPQVPDPNENWSDDAPPSPTPTVIVDSEDLKWYDKLLKDSQQQKLELCEEAKALGFELPRKCVNRGVQFSEMTTGDLVYPPGDIPFDPKSVQVTLNRERRWARVSEVKSNDPVYGEPNKKDYVIATPNNSAGFTDGHLKRLKKETVWIFRSTLFGNTAEDISQQCSKLNIGSKSRNKGNCSKSSLNTTPPLTDDKIPESKNLISSADLNASPGMEFFSSSVISSVPRDEDIMDLSEIPEDLNPPSPLS